MLQLVLLLISGTFLITAIIVYYLLVYKSLKDENALKKEEEIRYTHKLFKQAK